MNKIPFLTIHLILYSDGEKELFFYLKRMYWVNIVGGGGREGR